MTTFNAIARGRMLARAHVIVAALLATAIGFSNVDTAYAQQDPTTTKLSKTPAKPKPGKRVTLIAKVTSPAGTPFGNVTFREGKKIIGNNSLSKGEARFVTKFKAGRHRVTANYGGGPPNFAPSDDDLLINVKKPPKKSVIPGMAVDVGPGAKDGDNSPDVARLSGGGFVLVWQGSGGDGNEIQARRYDADGTALGNTLSVARGAATLAQPVAVSLGSGFVVAWVSGEQGSFTVEGQRFDGNGNKAGQAFSIGTSMADPGRAALAGLGDGFVAIWSAREGARSNIAGQRYDAAARKFGQQFEVNVTKSRDHNQPAVATLDEGFVVTWLSTGKAGADIVARRYDGKGAARGGEVRVNATPATAAASPQVAGLGADDFVVAWAQGDGDGLGIHAQRLGTEGKIGRGIRANAAVARDQSQPALAAFDDGTFAITWTSQDGSGKGIYARLFDDEGQASGAEFPVNGATGGNQWQPRAGALSDSRLIAVWTSAAAGRTSTIGGQSFDLTDTQSSAAR